MKKQLTAELPEITRKVKAFGEILTNTFPICIKANVNAKKAKKKIDRMIKDLRIFRKCFEQKPKQKTKRITIGRWIRQNKPSARLANIVKHYAFMQGLKYIHQIEPKTLRLMRNCGAKTVEEFKQKQKP